MDLKIPSAMVERHILPRQTKRTAIGFVVMIAILDVFVTVWK
jgi:hypothetical protein